MRETFLCLESSPKAESRRQPRNEALFTCDCHKTLRSIPGYSDLSRSRKELYRELVWLPLRILLCSGSAGRWRMFALYGIWHQVRASWTTSSYRSPGSLPGMRCPLASGLSKWAWHIFPIASAAAVVWKNRFARLLLPRASSPVLESCRIDPKQLVLLVGGYLGDNVDPPYRGEKRVVFLVILAVARMMIWKKRKKGLYNGANFCYLDLILFKLDAIKMLGPHNIRQKVFACSKPVLRKRGNIEVILPASSCALWRWSGYFWILSMVSR